MIVSPWPVRQPENVLRSPPPAGNARRMLAPYRSSASATTQPCRSRCAHRGGEVLTVSCRGGANRSRLHRESATTALWHRATSGPRTHTDARTAGRPRSPRGTSVCAGVVILATSTLERHVAPSCRAVHRPSSCTSRMSGQFSMTVVPSASRAAAISFRTLFFAPPTDTSPTSRFPPATRKASLKSNSLASGTDNGGPAERYLVPLAVHLTRIYTLTGDDGTTGLSGFLPRVQERSTAHRVRGRDETNASIGVALALGTPAEGSSTSPPGSRTTCSTPARISRRRSFRTPNTRRCA